MQTRRPRALDTRTNIGCADRTNHAPPSPGRLPEDWIRPSNNETAPAGPTRAPVTSSSLLRVGYDPEARALYVEFREGRLYRYEGVPPEVHEELLGAPSLGRYFVARVRGRYPCERLL